MYIYIYNFNAHIPFCSDFVEHGGTQYLFKAWLFSYGKIHFKHVH